MTSKITLTNLSDLNNHNSVVTNINNNNTTLVNAFDNTLSRDGSAPNQMAANLDMNHHRILNLPVPVYSTEAARKAEIDAIASTLPAATAFVGTFISIPTADISSLSSWVYVAGYYAPGDGGQALYRRVADDPGHPGSVQSSDGSWWEIAENELNFRQFGAVGDGVTNDQTTITNCLTTAEALSISTVRLGKGTFVISTITVPQRVSIIGGGRLSVFLRAPNASDDDVPLVMRYRSKLINCVVDGNIANNAELSSNSVLVDCYDDSLIEISGNIIKDTGGYGIVINDGRQITISNNEIDNCRLCPIAVYCNEGSTTQHNILNNRITNCVSYGLTVGGAENNIINNIIQGSLMGGIGSRMYVDTSGTTVTWKSGVDFTNVLVGHFMVLQGGQEFQVTAKTSNTSLTVSPAISTYTNVQAAFGCGDLCGLPHTSRCRIIDNNIGYCISFGIGITCSNESVWSSNNIIQGNTVHNTGKTGIVLTYFSGSGGLSDNAIVGNMIASVGQSPDGSMGDRSAINIYTGTAAKNTNVLIDGNIISSTTGDGQMQYWLTFGGATGPESVVVGSNTYSVMANPGVYQDNGNISYNMAGNATGLNSLVISNTTTTFPTGWGNTLKLTGPYAAHWTHDTNTDSGYLMGALSGVQLFTEDSGALQANPSIYAEKTNGYVAMGKATAPVCQLDVNGPIRVATYTVSTLPAASTGAGMIAYVTDANATTQNSVAAGGGSNKVLVLSDGTDWRIA